MSNESAPAYLTYLQTRLSLFANSTNEDDPEMVDAVNHLISKGNSFDIEIEYGETSYVGMIWNATKRVFTIHNNWIKDASGTDLKGSSIITVFNSVAMLKPNARDTIRMAKTPVDTKGNAKTA
jgi:hypothetical protein